MKRKWQVLLLLVLGVIFLCPKVYAEATQETIGNWIVEVEVNPLTDEQEIYLWTYCEDYRESGLSSDMKTLAIRFRGEPELYVVWNEDLGDNTLIRYRFDKGEIYEDFWDQSMDHEALFCPTSNIKDFIKKAIYAQKLIVGISPKYKIEQTAVFDLEGLKEAITPYLADFGWEDLFEDSNNEISL